MSFKEIPSYEGKYACNCDGVVISLKRWRVPENRELKPWVDKKGYLCVGLQSHDKKQKTWQLHRLVAMTWIKDFDSKLCVNHKDGNKKNNNILNLEMISFLENHKHAVETGLINNKGEKGESAKITNKQALDIREMYCKGQLSQRKLANIYGVDQSTIWAIVNNKTFIDIQGE